MKILLSNQIAPEGIKILQDAGFVAEMKTNLAGNALREEIKEYDVLVIRSETKVTKEIMENAGNLKLIARSGVGVDNIDVEYATKVGIAVMNSPASVSNAVAELVLGLIFAVLRNIVIADRMLRILQWKKENLVGSEITGKTVGIVGFGRIGQLLATRLKGFDCSVIAFNPRADEEKMRNLGVTKAENLDDLYKAADIITLHVPLNENTRNMINRDAIREMKRGVVIINTSRGGIVHEQDLYDALVNGKVGGAGIDTWQEEPPGDNKLLKIDTVVGTQHLGASTKEAQRRASIDIANQIIRAFKENILTNVVNGITTLKP